MPLLIKQEKENKLYGTGQEGAQRRFAALEQSIRWSIRSVLCYARCLHTTVLLRTDNPQAETSLIKQQATIMRRRGGRSCAGCSKSILLAVASILVPASVTADFMDAMPAFVSRPIYAGIPRCAPHEELCPVSSGSNDLHVSVAKSPRLCCSLEDGSPC